MFCTAKQWRDGARTCRRCIGSEPRRPSRALGIGLVTIAGLAALEALNEHSTKPFISDNVGLIAGVLITAAAVAAWNLAVWLSRKQSRLSEPRA